MSGWRYYRGTEEVLDLWPATVAHEFGATETVGARQLDIMLRARRGQGNVVLDHDRRGNKERMAAVRLVARGLLAGPYHFGGRPHGFTYSYTLTARGRTCWLRTKAEER